MNRFSLAVLFPLMLTACGKDCAKPTNPFPDIQYVMSAGNVDGVFVYSIEWLNSPIGVSSDTIRIAFRAVLFDQPAGNRLNPGDISVNGISLTPSAEGIFEHNVQAGNLAGFTDAINWQISGFQGHSDFNQAFPFQRSTFFNLDQAFSDFRTNSDFFVSLDRGTNGDDVYVFICGSEGCITTDADINNPGGQYTPEAFETTGLGNGLIQGTSRLIELVNIGTKTYAIIFQTTAAYHTEIIEGNEPKCDD